MRTLRRIGLTACVITIALAGCGKQEGETKSVATPPKIAEEKPAPYTYPPPVKGHYKDVNIGEFDVVDGIAFPAAGGGGTVVYVTDKPIASPMLAESACPMTEARALSELRNAHYLEVTLEPSGRSRYFAAGSAYGGSSREQDVGGRYWSAKVKTDDGRTVGSVLHRREGSFDFDLPVSAPKVNEISQGDWSDGKRANPSAPTPTEPAVTEAYRALHDAAVKKDLKALLLAQGFAKAQVNAILGLEGIDTDVVIYADRFLNGQPGEFTRGAGTAYVRVEGTNSKGKKFANYYHFVPCADHLVLVMIAENPQ
jgi:hypothetical protein